MVIHDPWAAHFPIDGARLDLVEEFRLKPRGPHGDELQKILHRMRWQGDLGESGRYVLLVLEPGRQWALARLPRQRGLPLERVPDRLYHSLVEAEWDVFKLRWAALTGQHLSQSLTESVL